MSTPDPALTAALKVMLADACWRCSDGTGQECAACIAEIAMRDDETSFANEQAMRDARWAALGDDEWSDL